MQLSGSWAFQQTWTYPDGHQTSDNFTATFNPDGTVTLSPDLPIIGFKMVWYSGQAAAQQIVLAGYGLGGLILAAYCGTMAPDNSSMSGAANGFAPEMPNLLRLLPVTGSWTAAAEPAST